MQAAEIEQGAGGEALGVNDPVEGPARIGGEVAFELDLPVDDGHVGGGMQNTAGQGGGEIGQGKGLRADEDLARKTMIDANEIGRIGGGFLKGRRGDCAVGPGGQRQPAVGPSTISGSTPSRSRSMSAGDSI